MGKRKQPVRARAMLELAFPGLRSTPWEITSRKTQRYNCIAWAAGETAIRWDLVQGAHWPQGVKKRLGIAYLIAAYMTVGFEVCSDAEATYDPDFDTIVVYQQSGDWTHAAKLLSNGMWSSKLGDGEDISHATPDALNCPSYGTPFRFMRRKKR
jgi:hypothetical protein